MSDQDRSDRRDEATIVRDGSSRLVALSRLEVLGWYYVVEVDTSSVTGAPP
jgi:hypothetical protein